MSSYSTKLKSLVDGLIAKTAANELTWQASDAAGSVETAVPSGVIVVGPDRDDSDQEAVRISVYDVKGDRKITFDDTEVIDWDIHGERIHYFSQMQNLLDDALRSARGEDKLLDSVLSDLGIESDEVPF